MGKAYDVSGSPSDGYHLWGTDSNGNLYTVGDKFALEVECVWWANENGYPLGQAPAALQPLPHTIGPKVRVMPLRTTYTPTQALQMALRFTENLDEVIVVGQFERGEDGRKDLYVSPSKMDISMAVWIHRRLGFYIDENA